jgi:hypothetical protein
VRAEHEQVVAAGAFGVPTLRFPDGQALFGPVLVDPPTGDAAVRLWSAVASWLEFPHLFELQRPKRPEDVQVIAERFRPYFEARDWETIQNPTP